MANLRPLALVVALATGCTSGGATAGGATAGGARIRVAAQPFALAEVARRVGLDRVVVSDEGTVVLNAGGDPDPWLDPVAMEAVTDRVAATLSGADPPGREAYLAAARAFRAQLGALDINYRSSLADCARHDIVTADTAFTRMASRYGFVDHAAGEPGVADLIATRGIPVVFTEPGVAAAPVQALAQATHTTVVQLETLTAGAPGRAARGATYLSLMADDLARLRTALACISS
ncbi:MAG: zinc transport system substrate-binding protein [Acidimicrobiaceae bacterium]|nr:zinc transport system substrate-binding protein [Acidimicrobiaceae bacterium]